VVVQAGSGSFQALLRVLERIVPPAAAAARRARKFAFAAGGAAALIALSLLSYGLPDSLAAWLGALLLLVLLAGPPVILFVFSESLSALAELPERLRALPSTGREHAAELAGLADRARSARRDSSLFPVPVLLWRLLRLATSSREALLVHAPLMPLVSVPFLGLTAVAAAAALLEIVVAFVLLVAVFGQNAF
jgi:hypothetical protein